jgi:uncharacterized protein YutE (UPF0331/DUF86 family)
MTKIDQQIIIRKAKFIQEDLGRLAKYQHLTLKRYLTDYLTQLIVERLLEKIVGRVIDINYHLLKTKHQTIPNDYYESFIQMGQAQEISPELAKQLSPAAGLRNALAHEYDSIDPKKIHASIKLALTRLPVYLKTILAKF